MNLLEISKKIDKSQENEEWVDVREIGEEFNVIVDYMEQDRLKSYWIGNWNCTDTWVGYRMYFLDSEPVCMSIQQARKSDEVFHWFGKEAALKVRDYLIELAYKKDDLHVDICDINEDIGDSYKIDFNGNMLKHNKDKATYEGKLITIVERIREKPDYGIDTKLKVKYKDSDEEFVVDIRELDFKYNLI